VRNGEVEVHLPVFFSPSRRNGRRFPMKRLSFCSNGGIVLFFLALLAISTFPLEAGKGKKEKEQNKKLEELTSRELKPTEIPAFQKGDEKILFKIEKAVLMNSMLGTEMPGDLTVELRTDFLPTESSSTYVSLGFRIPGAEIDWEKKKEDDGIQDLRIFGVITEAEDTKKAVRQLSYEVSRDTKGSAAADPIDRYTATLLEPGAYKAILGILDAHTGKYGCTVRPLQVPGFGGPDLSVSSLIFAKTITQATAPAENPIEGSIRYGDLIFQVDFTNTFKSADTPECFFMVRGEQKNPETGAPSLSADYRIEKGEEKIFDYSGKMDADVWGQQIPLKKFKPGDYVLTVTVTDGVAKRSATQKCAFSVVE
jgi:hypothetical protein